MCSVPGYDASGWVDDLAAELGKQLTSIAIGTTLCQNIHMFLCIILNLKKTIHLMQIRCALGI